MVQAMYNVFKQTSSDISSMLKSPRVFALLIIYVHLNDTDVMQYLQPTGDCDAWLHVCIYDFQRH